jgi:c(7)-type cytochrome triheme protein
VKVLDLDVLMNLKGGMPIVRFPHRAHTLWLDCANCHDHLFKAQAGANAISMFAILQGEQCGVCHGAVSFPLTECYRCHSVLRPGQSRPAVPPPLPGAKR